MSDLTFMGFMLPRDGYGYATVKIARQLHQINGTRIKDMAVKTPSAGDGGFGLVGDRTWKVDSPVVALCTPDWLPHIHAPRIISYTMFEATKLPAGWAQKLNDHAVAVLTPSDWCAEVFANNGVEIPIYTVRWGIDPHDYYPLPRFTRKRPRFARRRPYTFLWSGTPDMRKGWDLAYKAFIKAFGKSEDVHLIMHFRVFPKWLEGVRDPNVELIEGLFGRPKLRQMLQESDCFVFPSRGEGWGSPPREAAATGLPVITTRWGGLAEEIDHWALPIEVTGMSKANYGYWDDIGEWAEPDLDQLVERMRWCFEHRDQATEFGRQAALWLKENATWERTASRIMEVVGEPVR